MAVLEKFEWTNMWWDEPMNTGKRILLIGDSITNGYKGLVKNMMSNQYYIDMYATSRALDNGSFTRELEYMLEFCDLKYDVIHFNNGLHGTHQDIETYKNYYEKVIGYIMNTSMNSKLILVLSTPVTQKDDVTIFDEKNEIIRQRNHVVMKLAQKYNLLTNDLYNVVVGEPNIRNNDGFHYLERGYQILAEAVYNKISLI